MNHHTGVGLRIGLAFVLGFLLVGFSTQMANSGVWWNGNWHYRIPLTIAAAGYERYDKPVEVAVNFTSALSALGKSGAVADASIHVVETDAGGAIIDTAVAFQFDRATGYDPSSNASGNLIVLMKGTTAVGATRYFTVYFDLAGSGYTPQNIPAQVSYVDNVTFAGQSSYQISTPEWTLYYHKLGGGFAGMEDKNGVEWLGFDPTPGSGSGGEYRGVPNAVYNPPNPGFFHPGFTNSTSSVVHIGPLKMTIDTKSTDSGNPWECTWEIFPNYARMTMLVQGNSTYWFLFEGIPGGAYNATTNYVVRSDGTKTPGGTTWDGAIGAPEFAYFGDQGTNRVLYFVHHESDNLEDSYRPQNDLMTVFGFSRDLVVTSFFNSVPQHFTMGFSEDTTFSGASKVILASYKDIPGTLGTPEQFALTAPVPTSPADGATNTSTTIPFLWHSVQTATNYRLQVSTSATFAGGFAVDDSTIVDTARTVSGLTSGVQYYWHVLAKNSYGVSAYSSTRSFTTGLGVPALASPADSSILAGPTVALHWFSVSGSVAYHLQVSTDPTFASGLVINDSTITDTTQNAGGLQSGIRYFWRVASIGGAVQSAYSSSRTFLVALGAPTALLPANGATEQPVVMTFTWNRVAGAQEYHLQLATDSTFQTNWVKNDSSIVDTFRVVAGLQNNSRYFWRVGARAASVTGVFSTVRSFSTLQALPGLVTLVSPVNGATVFGDSITFVWHSTSPAASRYCIAVARDDSSFAIRYIDSSLTDTMKVMRNSGSYRLYWKVRSGNEMAWTDYTPVWFVDVITDVKTNLGNQLRSYSLEQNYPNPFNPSTTIEYSVPREGRVVLDVYNVLGEKIATLVDGLRSAGTYREVFHASNLTSGTYFYQLTTPEGTRLRKMLLLK